MTNMTDDIKKEMARAKRYIQAGRLEQAEDILLDINHPVAEEWLKKLKQMKAKRAQGTQKPKKSKSKAALMMQLQAIQDQIESRKKQRTAASVMILVSIFLTPVLGIGIILFPIFLFNYVRHGGAIKRLQKERLGLIAQMED